LIIDNKVRHFRHREREVLFVDLRKWGSEYEKMYVQLTPEDIGKIVKNFHNWQEVKFENTYKNIPEYCYSANFDEIEKNDFSLIPSKYIEFIDRDSGIDFDREMQRIRDDFKSLLMSEKKSQEEIVKAFKVLGYEL